MSRHLIGLSHYTSQVKFSSLNNPMMAMKVFGGFIKLNLMDLLHSTLGYCIQSGLGCSSRFLVFIALNKPSKLKFDYDKI